MLVDDEKKNLLNQCIQHSTSIYPSRTENDGYAGECWPLVKATWNKRSEACTKTTKGQYSPV